MTAPPKKTYRRFFQFRLSTWLVLVEFVAWAMACWPLYVERTSFVPLEELDEVVGNRTFPQVWTQIHPDGAVVIERELNPMVTRGLWIPLAFIGWKAFWLIRERRGDRAAHAAIE